MSKTATLLLHFGPLLQTCGTVYCPLSRLPSLITTDSKVICLPQFLPHLPWVVVGIPVLLLLHSVNLLCALNTLLRLFYIVKTRKSSCQMVQDRIDDVENIFNFNCAVIVMYVLSIYVGPRLNIAEELSGVQTADQNFYYKHYSRLLPKYTQTMHCRIPINN